MGLGFLLDTGGLTNRMKKERKTLFVLHLFNINSNTETNPSFLAYRQILCNRANRTYNQNKEMTYQILGS